MSLLDRIKSVFKEEEPVVEYKPRPRRVKKRDLPRCIYRNGNSFRVQKKINGRDYYFGSFSTLEEAVKRKYDLECVDWDKTKLK